MMSSQRQDIESDLVGSLLVLAERYSGEVLAEQEEQGAVQVLDLL